MQTSKGWRKDARYTLIFNVGDFNENERESQIWLSTMAEKIDLTMLKGCPITRISLT